MSPARHARGAVAAIFLLNGVIFGSWATRIPAVRDRLELSDGELGIALASIAIGAIVSMPLAGAVAARLGSRRAMRVSFALTCVVVAVIALAPSLGVLCVLAFLFGASFGALDVAMNAHGVAVERRYERPILAGFHAAFSGGGLAGAALGALAASADLDVRAHLAIVAFASGVVGMAWSRRLLPGHEDAAHHSEPLFVRPPRRLWALGALAFSCLLIEGAAADWSAVYLKDELHTTAATAALGFTAFSVTMTVGRIFGDRVVAHFGPVLVVRAGGAIAAVGFATALLAARPAMALVGFACLGAGMASVVPIVFRAAGQVPGVTAGIGLAAVSSTGYMGFMIGPPTIGALAELVGLSTALATIVVLGVAVFVLAPTARGRAGAPAHAEPRVVPV